MVHLLIALTTLGAMGGCGDTGIDDMSGDYAFAPVPPPQLGELPPRPCAALPAITSFVERRGSELWVGKQPFRAVGANIYFLQQLFAYAEAGDQDSASRAIEALDAAVCMNMRVVRTIGFNDSKDASSIRSAPGMYREQGLRGLDRAVAEARLRGIRLVISLVNNWADYGGLPQYAEWTGRPPEARDDFFGDSGMMQIWTGYASFLAERVNVYTGVAYKDEPAILAWEIGNELRCQSCRGSNRFVQTMSRLARHLKGVAPRHLIADGGDGFDDNPNAYAGLSNNYPVRGDEGTSYSRLLAINELDMVSYHFYPGGYGLSPARDASVWIAAHEKLAQQAGKIAYLGEFGSLNPQHQDPDGLRAATFQDWLSQLFEHSNGKLGLFWQLNVAARVPKEDDGYSVVYGKHPYTSVALSRWARRLLP